MAGENTKTAKAGEKKQIFKNLKSEFKKIVWLDRHDWSRRMIVVVAMSVIIALIIALLDFVIKYGVDLLLAL